MAKLRKAALSTGGVIVLCSCCWATCAVGTVYRWIVRYMQPAV
jgi:hypothetical protein